MNKKLILVVSVLCTAPVAVGARESADSLGFAGVQEEQAFTFTEAQLGEDDDAIQSVSALTSSTAIFRISRT